MFGSSIFAPLNLTNGILPIAALVVLSVVLPALLAGPTMSQVRLAVVMLATALAVWSVGAAIMALLYAQANGAATGGIWHYLERSGLTGLLWGPVLALVWLMRAQGVERRKGLLMGRGA
jgi:hypothetical protein